MERSRHPYARLSGSTSLEGDCSAGATSPPNSCHAPPPSTAEPSTHSFIRNRITYVSLRWLVPSFISSKVEGEAAAAEEDWPVLYKSRVLSYRRSRFRDAFELGREGRRARDERDVRLSPSTLTRPQELLRQLLQDVSNRTPRRADLLRLHNSTRGEPPPHSACSPLPVRRTALTALGQ